MCAYFYTNMMCRSVAHNLRAEAQKQDMKRSLSAGEVAPSTEELTEQEKCFQESAVLLLGVA